MKNFIQEGETLDLIAPSGGVIAGKGYAIGGIFAVAAVTADEGDTFAGVTEGVFELTKKTHASSQAITAGGPVYWDDTNKWCTPDVTAFQLIGAAVEAAASTASTVKVKLWPLAKAPESAITAVATTGASNSSPYGFTTAAQADAIVTKLNQVIAALGKHGIVVPN